MARHIQCHRLRQFQLPLQGHLVAIELPVPRRGHTVAHHFSPIIRGDPGRLQTTFPGMPRPAGRVFRRRHQVVAAQVAVDERRVATLVAIAGKAVRMPPRGRQRHADERHEPDRGGVLDLALLLAVLEGDPQVRDHRIQHDGV